MSILQLNQPGYLFYFTTKTVECSKLSRIGNAVLGISKYSKNKQHTHGHVSMYSKNKHDRLPLAMEGGRSQGRK
jgi:hypothetical protein